MGDGLSERNGPDRPRGVEVHPTPIYETLAMGLVAWLLWRYRDRVRPGVVFAWYLVAAGAERFLVEFVHRNEDTALGLTTAQIESLLIFAVGAVWLGLAARRGGLTPNARGGLTPNARGGLTPNAAT